MYFAGIVAKRIFFGNCARLRMAYAEKYKSVIITIDYIEADG